MELKAIDQTLMFEDSKNSFEITKLLGGNNDDILFMSKKPNITFTFKYNSRDFIEWKSCEIFCSLIREMIGHYILNDDDKNPSFLNDFIDLNNKTITWHSDSTSDNILRIRYSDRNILLSIEKDKKAKDYSNNTVKVRSNGSKYGNYYNHFIKLYEELNNLWYSTNPPEIAQSQDDKQKVYK